MNTHPLNIFSHCPKCGSEKFYANDSRSKKCQNCSFTFYLNAASAVAAIIKRNNEEILVTKRAINPHKGTLDLPGGFVEFNENAEEALKREIKEELNLEINNLKYEFSIPNNYLFSELEIKTLDLFFSCETSNEKIMPADDVNEAKYININELKEEDFGLDSIKKAIRFIKYGAEKQK